MTDSKLKLNANKTEFLIIGTPKQCGKLDGFFLTCNLSQNITPAASAKNLGVTFYKNFNFRQHMSQTCRCCFIISVIFAVFAGICHFLSLKLLQQLLLAADLITAIPSFIILLSRMLQNFNVSKMLWLGLLHDLLVSLAQCNFSNHCIGSLCDIALFLRTVQLPIKPFQPNNLHIYIQCSLQQDSPDSFGRLVLVYFLFPELRQTLELELSRLPHQLEFTPRQRKISKKYSFNSP